RHPPGDLHPALARLRRARDQAQQRRLAGAVRAHDRDALAARDLEGDAAQHPGRDVAHDAARARPLEQAVARARVVLVALAEALDAQRGAQSSSTRSALSATKTPQPASATTAASSAGAASVSHSGQAPCTTMPWSAVTSGVSGFHASSARAASGTIEAGYTIGVSQNQNWSAMPTPKPTSRKKTLSVPVRMPSPRASAGHSASTGSAPSSAAPGQRPVAASTASRAPAGHARVRT